MVTCNYQPKLIIAKRVLKAQEILPLLPDGHVKRHDLLIPSSMPIKVVCLSNNVTLGIAISTSNKPDIHDTGICHAHGHTA